MSNNPFPWQRTNRMRRKYITLSERLLNVVFRSVRSEYISNLNETGTFETAFALMSSQKVESEILSAYEKIYRVTGIAFANDVLKTFQSQVKKETVYETAWSMYFTNYVRNKTGERIGIVTRTLFSDVERITRAITQQGAADGWGPQKTERVLRKTLATSDKFRTMRIARTEVMSASNEGMLRGAMDSPIRLKKKWQVNLDSDTRDDHAAMADEDPIDLNKPFLVGGEELQRPGDPSGGAENVINCRCSCTFIPYDEDINDLFNF
jgi:hypothetical protein